jgi:hypothetical protein
VHVEPEQRREWLVDTVDIAGMYLEVQDVHVWQQVLQQ